MWRYPIEKIKIDRSFITELLDDADDLAITKATIAMAKALRMKVLAEGVESEAQLATLRALECDEYQGYLDGNLWPRNNLASCCGCAPTIDRTIEPTLRNLNFFAAFPNGASARSSNFYLSAEAPADSSRENVFEPLRRAVSRTVDQHRVEAAGWQTACSGKARQIMFSGPLQAVQLGRCEAGQCAAELPRTRVGTACAHLDKDQHRLVLHDQINFATNPAAHPIVALKQREAMRQQVSEGCCFCGSAATLLNGLTGGQGRFQGDATTMPSRKLA